MLVDCAQIADGVAFVSYTDPALTVDVGKYLHTQMEVLKDLLEKSFKIDWFDGWVGYFVSVEIFS